MVGGGGKITTADCIAAGANALVIARAPRGMRIIDGHTWYGRLFGPAAKPLTLRAAAEIAQMKLDAPLIASGGMHSSEDAREFIAAGAVAVQVDSAAWLGLIRDWRLAVVALAMALLLLACGIPNIALQNFTPTTTRTVSTPAPTGVTTATPLPTRTPMVAAPNWWARDLDTPKGAELTSNAKRVAVWQTPDTNVDGLRDFLMQEGTNAGYRVVVLTKSAGAIYDLLFVKGTNVYTMNITQGANNTILTANLGALIHLKVAGTVNVEVDLPVKDPMSTSAGGEMFVGTEIPNAQCNRCSYVVFIHIAPFKGPGVYASSPRGIYLIDALVVPGGDPLKDDYRWANDCTVVVKDATSGTFQCGGMSNIYDAAKKIDISGSWIQPPPP